MKKLILFFLLANTTFLFAQNIDEQRFSFSYQQSPLVKLDKSIPYNVTVDLNRYIKKSEDSIARYEYELNKFKTVWEQWNTQRKKIDKSYLLDMSQWEKARRSNPTLPQPIKQPYPPQPFKDETKLPILLIDLSPEDVAKTIKLDGFERGEGGLKINYSYNGLDNVNLKIETRGSGTNTKYNYYLTYSAPYSIRVVTPDGTEILNQSGGRDITKKLMGTFDTKYDYEYWKIDNYTAFWDNIQKQTYHNSINNANTLINDQFGYPTKNISMTVYTVKKFRKMNYSDLTNAYILAKQAYLSMPNESSENVKKQLKKAIDIWEEALQESYTQDRKARINKKVTALLYINLANAYLWSNDFNKADFYIQKAISLGVNRFSNVAKKLQPSVDDMRKRYEANK